MKILGHNFLASDFTKGLTPLWRTAGARQQRTLANIWKHIEGIGCRIVKPIDAEGKNWNIVVDGGSDVPPPDGFTFPWDPIYPFKVFASPDAEGDLTKIKVRDGLWVWYDTNGVRSDDVDTDDAVTSIHCGGVAGGDYDGDPNGVVTLTPTLAANTDYWVYVQLDWDEYRLSSGTLNVKFGETPPDPDTGGNIGRICYKLLARVSTNDDAHISTVTQVWRGGYILDHESFQQFRVLQISNTEVVIMGGNWQYSFRRWDGSSAYEEEFTFEDVQSSADILWNGGDEDSDNRVSEVFEVTQNVDFWLELDMTSYTGSSGSGVLKVIAQESGGVPSDPTFATDKYYKKIARVEWNGISSIIDRIRQYHSGSVVTVMPYPVIGSDTTINPMGTSADSSTWRSGYQTNLVIRRWRTDISGATVRTFWHDETYDVDGRLQFVDEETLDANVTFALP